jgi:gamma-glutamylcyclotransferase (GGCT)/AIG2-like uncharacterized protein YtfP
MSTVFVYGTLLKGMMRSSVLNTSHYLGPGIICADLYNLGSYPGIKDGDGIVVGEVYEVNKQTLNQLDEIEGYHPLYHQESLFVRQDYEVAMMNGNEVDCYVYSYNDRVNKRDRIIHGDYRRYRMEMKRDEQWIVGYGSNISSIRLIERVGEVLEFKKGYLNGYELIFNKKAYQHESVRANIRYDENSRCPVVAWRLSRSQLEKLDTFEGVPYQYLRVALSIMTDEGPLSAQGYIAHPSVLVTGLDIQNEYLEHIKNGYEEHGFEVQGWMKPVSE